MDEYHGVAVPDPYRWLEQADSPETRAFVAAQQQLTEAFLAEIPARAWLQKRLTAMWNFPRYSPPTRRQGHWYYWKNDGLQNQAVLYRQEGPEGTPGIVLDPNTLSEDGTVAVTGESISHSGEIIAYRVAVHGSDRQVIRLRHTGANQDLDETLDHCRFAGIAWASDDSGFYYDRYPAPDPETGQDELTHNALYWHVLGTDQSQDVKIYDRPDEPSLKFPPEISDDGRYLVLYVWHAAIQRNRLYYQDLTAGGPVVRLIDQPDASYQFLGNVGQVFYLLTDLGAPRGRIVAVDLDQPERDQWREIIPESDAVLDQARLVGQRIVVARLHQAHHRLFAHDLAGRQTHEIPLPAPGTVAQLKGRPRHRDLFLTYESYLQPPSVWRCDLETDQMEAIWTPNLAFDAAAYETRQHWYRSRDGTPVSIFLTHRKDLSRHGQNPTLLYGYGGFSISLTPVFSPTNLLWLEMGGIFAVPNLRGGNEYGDEWHRAGMLEQKQNVFDDFIAAAEWLIAEGYTRRDRLAIHGRSNGGLLVAACLSQRPDLFGAVLCGVPVIDMLRYHLFTAGRYWVAEYGDPANSEHFPFLHAYSPLHQIRPGVAYPPTLVYTADTDDRVVPLHALKFIAALQAAGREAGPLLLRYDTRAGHGLGKPTAMLIAEMADLLAFLTRVLDLPAPAAH